MVTKANLELMADSDGVGWITALKAPQIKRLVRSGSLQLSLFDQTNLAEISAPADYPGERLIVCRNPLVAGERARKRDELLAATEAEPQPDAPPRRRGGSRSPRASGAAGSPAPIRSGSRLARRSSATRCTSTSPSPSPTPA